MSCRLMVEPFNKDSQEDQTPVSTDATIRCIQLTKIFRDFWFRNRVRAVDGLDLEVHRGEVFGLLGPNGSGKSTTIKLILGLLHASSGRALVFNRRPEDVAVKSDIGYLPEESYLYRFLNARETLEYYGKLFHQSRTQRRQRIDMLLEMVGLDAVQRRPVGEYSKGMQRRIGLAQALINDPKLLILDEPTSGLDPIGTRQIKDLILELKRRGKTILLCSHLLADVEDVCDRVAIMFGGKVQRQGTVDQLLLQQSRTTIHTEQLDSATIDQIDVLLSRQGKHIDRVEQPRQKLESLFLQIVHEAQERGIQTAGVRAGGQIAGFLAEDDRLAHMPESVEAAEIIDRLTSVSDKSTPVNQVPDQVPAVEGQQGDTNEVLKKLESVADPADEVASAPGQATSQSQTAKENDTPVDHVLLDKLSGREKPDERKN